jgi:nucleoside-diphosphate-sugar epimerase
LKVALLGASSQIARDLIQEFVMRRKDIELKLYARSHQEMNNWLACASGKLGIACKPTEFFGQDHYDAIINLVGSGDPKLTADLDTKIVDITSQFDTKVMNYLEKHQHARYIYFSSGAVYSTGYTSPIDQDSSIWDESTCISSKAWYALSKIQAEQRHRSARDFCIFDIRLFSYFSASQNPQAGYLMSDILKSIQSSTVLATDSKNMGRDYVGPRDIFHLIECLLFTESANFSLDTYSASPISKQDIIDQFSRQFGLKVSQKQNQKHLKNEAETPAIRPPYYYSLNRRASKLGYKPTQTSSDMLLGETELFLNLSKNIAEIRADQKFPSWWKPLTYPQL